MMPAVSRGLGIMLLGASAIIQQLLAFGGNKKFHYFSLGFATFLFVRSTVFKKDLIRIAIFDILFSKGLKFILFTYILSSITMS